MNACVRAIVRIGAYHGLEVFGFERGYEGLMAGDMRRLGPRDVSDTIQRGGTFLRTARSEAFYTRAGLQRAADTLAGHKIGGLIAIGGNGTLMGALDLAGFGAKVIGLPGTIDNDLAYTDQTIGFDTAVNTALYAISNIRDTSTSHERVTIIEVMGRECGDIAVYAGLTGGAEIILVPEKPVDIDDICRTLIESRNKGKKSSIIVKAEGVDIGLAALNREIAGRTGLDVKDVVLGYIQRGGTPTANDRMLASVLGAKAVELIKEDIHGVAVGMVNGEVVWPALGEAMKMKKRDIAPLYDLAKLLAL